MAEGSITIDVEASTSKFDKQIAKLQRDIAKQENKKILIDTKLTGQEQELDIARKKTDELAEAYQRLKTIKEQASKGTATPEQFTTMLDLQNTYGTLEQIGGSLDKALSKQEAIALKVKQTKAKYEEINTKVQDYKTKIESIRMDKHASDVERMKNGFAGVGNSLEDAVKKASRLVLGIFGIRSAYMALRRASSDLATYDKEYATNLEYIRFVLTQAIAPVLRWIIQMVIKLLSYINAIAQAWFGVNLFANGSADSFKRMKSQAQGVNDAVGGVSKAVKQIKKQLSGFDEVNVLSADTEGGVGAGAGGVGTNLPEMSDLPDLSKIQGEVPRWLKWLLQNGDTVKKILKALGAVMVGMKIADFIKGLGLLGQSFSALQTLLLGLGIGLIIYGIYEAIQGLIAFIEDPSWENFAKVLDGIAIALAGVGAAIIAVEATNPVGWVILLIAGIVALVSAVIKHWNEIKAVLDKVGNWIYEHLIKPVGDFFKGLWEKIKEIFRPIADFFKSLFSQIIANVKILADNFKKIFVAIFAKIKEIFTPIIEWFKGIFNKVKETIQKVFEPVITFFSSMWDRIKNKLKEFAAKIGEAIGGAFKTVINGAITAIEWILNAPIKAINGLIGVINKLGLDLTYLNEFHLPRLATGGIVNVPNTGTLVGGAIAGEAGAEGVIPLTDTQAMETLGEAIGRYITINATIENRMNGRVLSRELRQIKNQQEFAYNA